ncbi:acyl-CoA dehydrogenase protein [Oesophagostomum dentatum]|uniref:Acyl-CoA dehydrogenase protein n=1 Tax=Oesophagostomum dentatum TaxID=61180 RepID=A0A0B1TEI1_OESDE|nr:acyl-CoA dehydrogenase protein [Oesophagostomum dentatum]
MCVPLISEAMECFGGQGYIEDTGIPAALRDAQVTPIWEGTTNILSLDVLRVFGGKDDVFEAFVKRTDQLLPSKDSQGLQEPITAVREAIVALRSVLQKALKASGDSESSNASDVDATLLRLITPIVKLYTGKMCVPLISEAMECFGGQGYIEDTGIPAALRDAQVTPIWEGTTNILSLDVLRVFGGKEDVFEAFVKRTDQLLPSKDSQGLQEPITAVREAIVALRSVLQKALKASGDSVRADACARQIAFGIARIWAGA